MNISEYGKVLKDIGKEICDMSNNSEKNLIQNLNNNINICQKTVQQLKNIETPSFISNEHVNLTNIFEQLISAYSLQIISINDERKISNVELFQKGKKIEDEETKKIGPILISMLIKSSSLTSS